MKYLLALLLPVLVMCDMEDKPRWDIEKVEWPQDLSKMEDIPKMDSTKFFEGRIWYVDIVSDDSLGIEVLNNLQDIKPNSLSVFFIKGEHERVTYIERDGRQIHSINMDKEGKNYMFAENGTFVGVSNIKTFQQSHERTVHFTKPDTSDLIRYGRKCMFMHEQSADGRSTIYYWVPGLLNLDMSKINNPDHPSFDKIFAMRNTYNVITIYSVMNGNQKKYKIRLLYKVEPCKLKHSDFYIPDRPQKEFE